MTNEEILRAVARDYHSIESDSDLADCIRSLVVQAYEEAAREAEFPIHTNLADCGEQPQEGCRTGGYIARSIRLLKESLVPASSP